VNHLQTGDAPFQGSTQSFVSFYHNDVIERPAYLHKSFRHRACAGSEFEHTTYS